MVTKGLNTEMCFVFVIYKKAIDKLLEDLIKENLGYQISGPRADPIIESYALFIAYDRELIYWIGVFG